MARAPARPQATASGGALGLQANLFGRLIRVVRSYANAIGVPPALPRLFDIHLWQPNFVVENIWVTENNCTCHA